MRLPTMLLFLLLPAAGFPTSVTESRRASAQEMAAEFSLFHIHKLYVPDFCDSDSHPTGPGAYFAANFSEFLTETPKKFAVQDRVEAHHFLIDNHWTDCDLTNGDASPDILHKFAEKFGVDAILNARLFSNDNGYSLDFILRDLSGKALFRSPYFESPDPLVEGAFPAASAPSGWPFYFIHHDGVTVPRCIKCIASPLRKPGVTGNIVISVYFAVDGALEQFRVVQSLDPDLDTAALNTIKSWQYAPAKSPDGSPVPVRLSVEFPVTSN